MKPKSLMDFLSIIPDPRIDRCKRHNLLDILVIAICGVMSGCETWIEIEDYGSKNRNWFSEFLELPNGIASHDTFGRVFSILNPVEVQKVFMEWVREIAELLPREVVSIDGKTLRASMREKWRPRSALSMVSAWATEAGIVLGQRQFEFKKEVAEKQAAEKLIQTLFLKGCIVTLDANGATTKISKAIVDKGADYLIGLKSNQKVLLKYCEKGFDRAKDIAVYKTQEKAHGREETREYFQIGTDRFLLDVGEKIGWSRQQQKWPTLKSFGKVICQISRDGETTATTRYYFSSMTENVSEFARAARSHWGIENRLNWTLDVVFKEDASRVRIKNAAQNLATLRRMVLNLLRKDATTKKSIRRKRLNCAWDKDYMLSLLKAAPEAI